MFDSILGLWVIQAVSGVSYFSWHGQNIVYEKNIFNTKRNDLKIHVLTS